MSEEKNAGIKFLAECEDCHVKFEVFETNVFKKWFEVSGSKIMLTYYDCPKCGRRHFVQIDDETSRQKLVNAKMQMMKLIVAKKKNKLKRKQSEEFERTRKDLSEYRKNLMKTFTDKELYDEESDMHFVLKFSV